MMLKAAAESGAGHLRVVPAQWPETRENDLRLSDWENVRDLMRDTEGITVVTPHARTEGLLAFGTRVAGVEILGVDPDTEQQTNRLVRNIPEGHYLIAGELEMWIGERHFHLHPGDSFRFKGERHRWRNPGPEPAIAIWVIAPPVY